MSSQKHLRPGRPSPLDDHLEYIHGLHLEGASPAQIHERLSDLGVRTTRRSVQRAIDRAGEPKRSKHRKPKASKPTKPKGEPNFTLEGDTATLQGGDPAGTEITPDDLMRLHGLDPEDWEIERVVVNKWDAMMGEQAQNRSKPMYQLKVTLKRKRPITFVFPAREPGSYKAPKLKAPKKDKPQLWVVAGDEQVPHHHEDLHVALCSFLAAEQPHGMVGTGDLTDQNSISRHKANPEWHNELQVELDTAYLLQRDYRESCESMEMHWMPGNHDERIRALLLERAQKLYGIRRAQVPGEEAGQSVLDLPYLLRFDELGINYVDPGGQYEHAQFKIGPHVAVRHGSRTGKNAALDTVDRLTHSVIVGHTHGQSIRNKTVWDIDRNHRVVQAVETGTLTNLTGGLGYAVDPNWVNGFVTVTLYPNGQHHIEHAIYHDDALYWRGQRYS